jgi:hypothetical protein
MLGFMGGADDGEDGEVNCLRLTANQFRKKLNRLQISLASE